MCANAAAAGFTEVTCTSVPESYTVRAMPANTSS